MDNTLMEYLSTWYDPDDLVRVSLFLQDGGKSFGSFHAKDLARCDLSPAATVKGNIYVQVYPTIEDLGLSTTKRGGDENARCIRGLYLDVDCGKTAAFHTQREVLAYLDRFPVEPTMIVGSGSGGVHAYWRFTEDQPVDVKPLIFQWWVYAQSLTDEATIDRLRDVARMLRLPSDCSYRFKPEQEPRRVCILRNTGTRYSREQLEQISAPAFAQYEQAQKPRREHEKKIHKERIQFESNYEADDWEQTFNDTFSWEYILESAGWSHNRSLPDCEEWTRPGEGATPRSATVDWVDNPNVMSLLSASPETGLLDLYLDDVPLSKWRVMCQLHYEGSFLKMMLDLGLNN